MDFGTYAAIGRIVILLVGFACIGISGLLKLGNNWLDGDENLGTVSSWVIYPMLMLGIFLVYLVIFG